MIRSWKLDVVGAAWPFGTLAIYHWSHVGGFDESTGTRTGPFSGLGMGRNSTQ